MSMRVRFADTDRETYGLPEWIDWSDTADWLIGLPGDECIAIDEEMRPQFPEVDGPLSWLCLHIYNRATQMRKMRFARAFAWLMAKSTGADVGPLAEFYPKLLGMQVEDGEPVPPSDGEASSDTLTPGGQEASPGSGTSTTGSDPGLATATQE